MPFFHVKEKTERVNFHRDMPLTGILLCGKCGDYETLEEGALNRAVIHRITRNEGDFAGAFRKNVIRVIGS